MAEYRTYTTKRIRNYTEAQIKELRSAKTHNINTAKTYASRHKKSYRSVISKIKELGLNYETLEVVAPKQPTISKEKLIKQLELKVGTKFTTSFVKGATKSDLIALIGPQQPQDLS